MSKTLLLAVAAAIALTTGMAASSQAKPVFLSADWAAEACRLRNQDPILTKHLIDSGWMANDAQRGFKQVRIVRRDCAGSPPAEIRTAVLDEKASCVYGGAARGTDLDLEADYLLTASTEHWAAMAAGEYGPMRSILLGILELQGPRQEAMTNLRPLREFLLLTGRVEAETGACP